VDDNPISEVAEHIGGREVDPATGISALALGFALKYHDMMLVKDGVMYQAKKMEGVNFRLIDLPDVLETARQFEAWFLNAPERMCKMIDDGTIAITVDQATGNLIQPDDDA